MRNRNEPRLRTSNWHRVILMLVVAMALLSNGDRPAVSVNGSVTVEPGGQRLPGYCSLFSDDIVVRGVIEAVDTMTVPYASWAQKVPAVMRTRGEPLIEIVKVTMSLDEVMRGEAAGQSFEFTLALRDHDLEHNYALGDTVIVSCVYWEWRLGGSYSIRSDCGRFIRRGDVWVNQERYGEFTLDEIRQMLREETDVRYFAKEADVIAVVRMGSLRPDSTFYGPKGSSCQVGIMSAPIEQVLKGTVEGDKMTFRVGGSGNYWPTWRRSTTKLHGGRWIVFLKRGPVGLYPMGGANGMLKIQGEKLLRNNRVEYPYTLKAVESLVAEEVGR